MTTVESPHPNINEIYNEMRRLSMDTIPLQLQSSTPIDEPSVSGGQLAEAEQSTNASAKERDETLSVDDAKKLWSNYHRTKSTTNQPSQLNNYDNNDKEKMFKRQQSKSSTTQTTLDESDVISGALSISDYYPNEEHKMCTTSSNDGMPKHWPRTNPSLSEDESSNKQHQQQEKQKDTTMPKHKKKKPTYRRRSMAHLPSTTSHSSSTNSSNNENCNWNDRVQEILNRPSGMSPLQAAQLQQQQQQKNSPSNNGEGRKRAAYQRRHSVQVTNCPPCPFKSTSHNGKGRRSQVREIIFDCNGKPPTQDMLHMTSVLYERQKEASDRSASSYESTVPTVVDTSRKASLYMGGGEGILDESYVSSLSTPSVLLTDARSVGMNKSVSSHAEEKSSAQSSSGVSSSHQCTEEKKPINRRRHTIEEDMNCLDALQKLGLSSGNVSGGSSSKSNTSNNIYNGSTAKKTDTKKTRPVFKERRRSSDSDVPSKETLKKAGLCRRNSIEEDMSCLDALKKLDLSNSATSGLDNSPSSHLEKSKNQVPSIQQPKMKKSITTSSDIKNVKASFRRRHTVDEDMNCLQALKKLDLSSSKQALKKLDLSSSSNTLNQASWNLNSEPSTSSSISNGGSNKSRDKVSRRSSSKKKSSNNGSFTSTSTSEQIEQDVKMRIIRRRRHSMQDQQLHNLKAQQLQIQMQLQLQKDMAAKKKYNEEVLQCDLSSKKKDVYKKNSDKAESTVPRPRRVTPISDEQNTSASHLNNNKSRRRSQSNGGTVKSSKSSPTSSPSIKSKSRLEFKTRRRSSDSDVPSTNKWTAAMKRYVEETNAQDTIARYVKEMESKDGTDMDIDQYVDEMEADLFSTDEEDYDEDDDDEEEEDDGEVSDIIRMVSGRNSSLSRYLHHQLNDFDQGHQDRGAVKRRTRSTNRRRSSRTPTPTTLASSFSTPSTRSQVYEMKQAVAHHPTRNAFFVHTSPLDESVSSLEASFRSGYDYGTDHNGVSLGSYGRSIAGRHFMGMGVPVEEKRVSKKKKKVNGWFQRRRRRRASCTGGLDVSGSSGSYEQAQQKKGGTLMKQEKTGGRFNRRRRFSDCGITSRPESF